MKSYMKKGAGLLGEEFLLTECLGQLDYPEGEKLIAQIEKHLGKYLWQK